SFYDQINGVATGSPLAPVLANRFMGHHEKLCLENFHGSTILFYRRYVDDTFCLFNSDRDATIFFDYINSRHPNINFTSYSYKVGLIKTLVNRAYKINSTWLGFHEDI
ncbi:unnamed protein product, partial [Pocillopora meandrina]